MPLPGFLGCDSVPKSLLSAQLPFDYLFGFGFIRNRSVVIDYEMRFDVLIFNIFMVGSPVVFSDLSQPPIEILLGLELLALVLHINKSLVNIVYYS